MRREITVNEARLLLFALANSYDQHASEARLGGKPGSAENMEGATRRGEVSEGGAGCGEEWKAWMVAHGQWENNEEDGEEELEKEDSKVSFQKTKVCGIS